MERVKRFKIPLFFVLSGIVLLPLIKGFLKLLEKSFNTSFGIGTIFITWLLIDTIVILAINCIKTTKENSKIEVEGVKLKKKDGTFGTADWGTKEEINDNKALAKDRIFIEHTNSWIKRFKILSTKFRNHLSHFAKFAVVLCGFYNFDRA